MAMRQLPATRCVVANGLRCCRCCAAKSTVVDVAPRKRHFASAREPLSYSTGGSLAVGLAGTKGAGVFATRKIEVGEELLRVPLGSKSNVQPPKNAEGATSRPSSYVLDAAVPMGDLGEEEQERLKRFPFLADPRLWPAVAAPRTLSVGQGKQLSVEDLHGRCVTPFFASSAPGGNGQGYVEHGFLNHACYPNVTRYFHKGALVLRSNRHIEKDEEILDTYFYPLVPVHLREKACSSDPLNFDCDCPRCRAERTLPKSVQVWSRLTWENTVRILGEVALTRARARGDPAALKSSPQISMALQQLNGLIEGTEYRLSEQSLPEAEFRFCLASWAAPAASLGDLFASVADEYEAASATLAKAALWAEFVAPGAAISLWARSAAYGMAANGKIPVEAKTALEELHRRTFGDDFAIFETLPLLK